MTKEIMPYGKATAFGLRHHNKSCANCRYFRIHTTGCSTSECILIGTTIGIITTGREYTLFGWARERLCDHWKKRPGTWDIYSKGAKSNPHWHDKHYKREQLQKMSSRIVKRYKAT